MIWHVVNMDCPLHIIVDTFTFTYNFGFNLFFIWLIIMKIYWNQSKYPHSPQVTTYNPLIVLKCDL